MSRKTARSNIKRVAKRVPQARRTAWHSGWEDGFRLGMSGGYHYGRCDAVMRLLPNDPIGWWDVRVLYVTSGKGVPYSPLDEAVMGALQRLVRELIVLQPSQDWKTAALKTRPDIVLVLEGLNIPVERIDELRAEGIRTAIWLTDDPYYTDLTAPLVTHYDVVFTLELACVEFYRRLGCGQVYYLPFGSNPAIFRPKRVPIQFRHDISFIGSAYWNRVAFFDQMTPFLAARNTYIAGIWWERLRQFQLLSPKIALNNWMGAEETAAHYNGTKIVINLHRATDDPSYNFNSQGVGAVSPNPRTFEIAGCGTLLLTDVRSDITRFYTPGLEIVTYASPSELMHKIDYYLHHEEERRFIALNALRRTMLEHTYPHRMAQMMRILFEGASG
ncbi:CgeB family protein [Paenibacillus ehimensis]|uniref:CgeB family protein n=1 Tax=Paenibacillus ehimensis TaxID=79264 RepID=UPI000FD72449|nr:glycosyltransferase [Paenibacillus ehimensis]MEC0211183.1 glycosyltransferase [Paenibacillus ehimensis]